MQWSPMYNKNEPETIKAMFGNIAKSYDRTNLVLSFQMNKWWNRQLVKKVVEPSNPDALLDLCCGTGEIAFTYLKHSKKPCNVHLLDFCNEMLICAKEKSQNLSFNYPHTLSYIQADAQKIPLKDSSVDCATIAYGIRNVKEPSVCLKEVYRVLQPGGSFGILELTRPDNIILRGMHSIYLRTVVPILGWFCTSDKNAYQYLCNSIHNFVEPSVLEKTLSQVGFEKIKKIPLMGGIATILFAKKPN
jgi:demethylmenaquinone methyltransferase / 2-methoxy-6-polyprenyl-1,4-benzoquinol methylase